MCHGPIYNKPMLRPPVATSPNNLRDEMGGEFALENSYCRNIPVCLELNLMQFTDHSTTIGYVQ